MYVVGGAGVGSGVPATHGCGLGLCGMELWVTPGWEPVSKDDLVSA